MVKWGGMTGGMAWARRTTRDWGSRFASCGCTETEDCKNVGWMWATLRSELPDLIVTVGWRHLVPADIIEQTPLGVVGFHSALLPEYP
jgi:methionyl-tRNA formyltransferase